MLLTEFSFPHCLVFSLANNYTKDLYYIIEAFMYVYLLSEENSL